MGPRSSDSVSMSFRGVEIQRTSPRGPGWGGMFPASGGQPRGSV